MAHSEMKNAPPLHGWAIAVAAGAVASAISFLVVGIEGNGSVAIGAVIALIVGVIFTIAESLAKPVSPKVAAPAPAPMAAPAPAASAAAPAAVAPVAAEASAATPAEDGTKPEMLAGPDGTADDLKQISGVGPVLESKLNELGVYHFWQIARWSAAEVAWVDDAISFKGRITRDDWVTQAVKLAAASPVKPPA